MALTLDGPRNGADGIPLDSADEPLFTSEQVQAGAYAKGEAFGLDEVKVARSESPDNCRNIGPDIEAKASVDI